ncbi:type II 3-dehydroquinate dehydratase [Alteromonas ponticola]|uniref:3-dehydroquinate dehydratase n=1 Tax=Alteromonas ponticola TaxID=2720613 RepID=A0ABX1R6G6_9ALTE|nr:type II 3-dehydroquinate dehydratase [Alteromonas ponticola]NMH60820.1 type II 3-dehydroquinate dehydratase [Alteromonas ponticola]
MNILLLNGPNLNMLGQREPDKYGTQTLAEIVESVKALAQQHAVSLDHFQSNAEHALIDRVQQALGKVDAIIINPGAFTHTSIALRDALLSVGIPFYEVHLSNVHARENFRHHSYFSDIAAGVLVGMGSLGYQLALTAAVSHFNSN